MRLPTLSVITVFISAAVCVRSQTTAQTGPDELILKDGEKVIGQLQSSTGTAASFKSDALGVLTIEWSKVQELHSQRTFAAIPKGVPVKKSEAAKTPQGK